MEGGAMRGLFTAGVLDVFLEEGLSFDGAIGVSAGAVFGCNIKSRQAGRVLRYNKKYCRDKRYASWSSLLRSGDLYNVQFDYEEIPNVLDPFDQKTYEENPMAFYIVATDANSGKPVYHRCDKGDAHDITWMRASASMPGFSRMVEVEGLSLSDGGTADSIPLQYFQGLGYEKNVVIATQPKGYVKEPNRLLPLLRLKLRDYPQLLAALANRHERYNETLRYLEQEEAAGRILLIRPPEALHIGALCRQPEELQRVYDLGYAQGRAQLEQLRAFMAQ